MNCLLSALLPAHAALAAASASQIPAPSIHCDLVLAKYIIVERDGLEFPILFHRDLQHSEVLSPKAGKPVSAGFYQFIAADLILAGGESTTLKLRARLQDADIIKRHLLLPS